MRRAARFICSASQPPDTEAGFRQIVSAGPWRRDDGENRWHLYRRSFVLEAPESGICTITADGRYQLFVNGAFVGRGPGRCSPSFQRLDRYDLSGHLHAAKNTIAVLVHSYGVDTAWYERTRDYWQGLMGDGGLYVSVDIEDSGSSVSAHTDSTWRCAVCPAWRQDVPRSGWGQDFIEDFDAGLYPEDWQSETFDDASWPQAQEMIVETGPDDRAKGWGTIEPFPTLLPREIPHLTEIPREPEAVLAIYQVTPMPELEIDERIYQEPLQPGHEDLVTDPQAMLADDDRCTTIRTSSSHDTSVLVRFDRIHSGHPFIELDAAGGEVVEVAVAETVPGEYRGELLQPARVARQTYLDCAHVFRYTARPGLQQFEKFEWTAVRYLQLTVRNAPAGVRIRRVGSTYTHYPVEHLGAFECSEPVLNRLWEIGRYTALQCTHDAREDCPGREKRQWLGDGLVQYLIAAAAFGPSTRAMDRLFLNQGMESQRPDGLLQMFAPGDHHVSGIVIPDFSLHWIATLHHYFQHYGDFETLLDLFPAAQRVLAWFAAQSGADDLIADLPYWHFIEWAHIERRGVSLPLNALLIGAQRAAADLAAALGNERLARRYRERAGRAASALNALHWDDARGAYVDSVDPETGSRRQKISQQGNALMIYHEIAPRDRWDRMLERITDPGRLKLTAVPPVVPAGEPFEMEEDVVRANTFFSHFVFCALGRARRFDLALEQIRSSYEPMIATGTETLWESFEPAASLCHAFSATPVYQLSAHCLGVTPAAPGCSRVCIAPQPGNLRWARGSYPTVLGGVEVGWQKEASALTLTLNIPEGMVAEVVAPPGFVDDRVDGRAELGPGSHRLSFHAVEHAE